jgi:hypothetical protein
MPTRRVGRYDPRVLAAEIIRRVGDCGYVIHLAAPSTATQKLQLMACRILERPVVIMPTPCATVEEWLERRAQQIGDARPHRSSQTPVEGRAPEPAPLDASREEAPHVPPLRLVAVNSR